MQKSPRHPDETLDPNAKPASQDQINQPGMNNGVPDQAGEAQSKGRPHDERKSSETAPASGKP